MQRHILVVEDEQHLAVGIKYNLQAEGYRVTVANDGPSALDYLQQHPQQVDLVILDLMLPGMSGYTVCERLRETGQDLPILILSARTLSEDRTRGFEVGADQYLSKPFDLDELLIRVKSLLALFDRRAKGKPLPLARRRFSFAGNEIDFESYDVKIGGRPTRMTELEIRLLKYFVDHEGRVIRREELLENVWEVPGSITTRSVDQFIRRLRKLFEPDPSRPRFFLTIRDAGYRFVSNGSGQPQQQEE